MHPRRHHPTLWAAVFTINRLDLDPATPQRQIDRIDHPVAGQVEDHARSVTPRARRLKHSSWPFLDGFIDTPISAQGHEPLHHRLTTPNCEMPVRPATAARVRFASRLQNIPRPGIRHPQPVHELASPPTLLDVLGGRIQTIRSVVNPDKLGHVGPVADAWAIAREAKQARRSRD